MEEKVINNSSFREIPNVRKIYWIWHDNYLSVEKIKRQEFWRINKLNLKPTITPKLFNLDVTEWKWDESGTKSSNGGTFEKQLVGFVPKLNEWLESYLNEMVNRKMVIFIETFNDSVYLFGGEKCRAQFSFTKSINSRNGYELTFTTLSDESSLIINDEDFFPAAEENPGCEPVLIALNGDELHTAASGAEVQINLKDQDDVTVVPLDIDIVGDEINIKVQSAIEQAENVGLVDRFGNSIFSSITILKDDVIDLRTLNPVDWADLYLSRLTNPPTGAQETAVFDFYEDMIAAGIFQGSHKIELDIGGNAADHAWNARYPFDNNSSMKSEYIGSPTHNANGVSLNGSSQAVRTNAYARYLEDYNKEIAIYVRTCPYKDGQTIFNAGNSYSAQGYTFLQSIGRNRWATEGLAIAPNTTAILGLNSIGRNSATTMYMKRNNVHTVNSPYTGSSVFNKVGDEITIGAFMSQALVFSSFAELNYSYFRVGNALNDTQQTDHYNIVQALQTAFSRQV